MQRNRRFRMNESLRRFRRELSLKTSDFIMPYFLVEGEGVKRPIPSMTGQYHYSVDMLLKELGEAISLGIEAIMLFGIPEEKDEEASDAYSDDGIIQKALRKIKKAYPNLLVITDLCMCEYTSSGHCGILDDKGCVDNDITLGYLEKIALAQARNGSDIICPSDMMDFRVKVIRDALDNNGFVNTPIMVHSAKFASSYYGPFREAASSCPTKGDRKNYQMDFHNKKEALLEAKSDIEEGADMLIVKPALTNLDIVKTFSDSFDLPIVTYNVSGEYQMLIRAVEEGILKSDAIYEALVCMKRAGADKIVSYFAKYAAENIKRGNW